MKAIEVNGIINNLGNLELEELIKLAPNTAVRVIILSDEDNDHLDNSSEALFRWEDILPLDD
jgi:hypothetical protein